MGTNGETAIGTSDAGDGRPEVENLTLERDDQVAWQLANLERRIEALGERVGRLEGSLRDSVAELAPVVRPSRVTDALVTRWMTAGIRISCAPARSISSRTVRSTLRTTRIPSCKKS